jgi:hypothetical protein
MAQVTFEIPDRLLGDFYIAVGLVLKRAEEDPAPSQAGPELHDWGTEAFDAEVARMAWRKFSPKAQAVFSLLMDNPGVAMSADDIASKIGLSNGRHSLAGVVAWPSRQCAELGLAAPFRFENPGAPGDTGSYWMDADTASLFVAARSEYLEKLGRPPRT